MSSSLDTVTKNLMNNFLKNYEIESSGTIRDFETFVTYSAIKNNYSAHFETSDFDSVLVGGNLDTGIDGIGIIIDNNLVSDLEEVERIIGNKDSLEIKFVFVQTTVSKKFQATKFRDFTLGVREFFYDYAKPDTRKTKTRNSHIQEKAKITSCVLEKVSLMLERPDCKLYYCLGNDIESKLGINNNVVEAEKEELLNLNIFNKVDIRIIGTRSLHDLYRLTLAKPKVQIYFPDRIAFPQIEGVKESYIGRINFSEFKKLIVDDSSGTIKNVFEDNVRYFNEKYKINKKIEETITKGDVDKFVLLNNGVTIVTKKISISADYLTLEDYQIVNGCQTSNILYKCRDKPNIERLNLTLKIINTEKSEIANAITTATNSQTEVSFESLNSLLKFHKDLELYYQATSYKIGSKDFYLYYGRQEGKYDKDPNITKTRIVSIKEQAKSFIGMFLDAPEESYGFYSQRLQKRVGQDLFIDNHYFEPYYVSAVCHYEIYTYIRNKNNNITKFGTYRFHILMLMKYIILQENVPERSDPAIKQYCLKILKTIKNKSNFENYIQKSVTIIRETLKEEKLEISEAKKLVSFTKQLKNNLNEF